MNYSPVVMEDARLFSNYKPSAIYEKQMQVQNGVKDNESYRRFLVNNTQHILNKNRQNSFQQNVPMIFDTQKPGKNVPHLFDSIRDTSTPNGYETNDVKIKYLTRQELAASQKNKYKYCNV